MSREINSADLRTAYHAVDTKLGRRSIFATYITQASCATEKLAFDFSHISDSNCHERMRFDIEIESQIVVSVGKVSKQTSCALGDSLHRASLE